MSLLVLLFALPFYFGYGDFIPFTNPDYSFFDNVWLSAFPLILVGLALGWKYEKIGGYLLVVPTIIGILLGIVVVKEGLPGPMYVPLILGILYLVVGYFKK